MLRDTIKAAQTEAMKAGDKARLAAVRLILAKIKDKDIELRTATNVPDDDVLVTDVLQKMAKQRRESITLYEQGGRLELAAIEPDPVRRDLLVRSLLADQGGFLTRAVTLQRRHEASMMWNGLRGSFSARVFSGDTSRLDRVSGAQDDLAGAGSVRQRGWGLNASYRLSPRASASRGYTSTTTADAGNQPGNDQQSASFTLSQQLAQRATLSLTLRHTAFDSVLRPYDENAAVLLLSLRF